MTYNSLQGIFTTMIGFVTWPPCQVTKPIIVVKTIVCHSSKMILNKMFNFLALLDIRVFGLVASDWPRTFLQPGCFY